jgi:hypothetical protein
VLLLAEVAEADLGQRGDAFEPRGDVVHDRRVRPGEALVGLAQVRVRVEVQHAEAGEALAGAWIAPKGTEWSPPTIAGIFPASRTAFVARRTIALTSRRARSRARGPSRASGRSRSPPTAMIRSAFAPASSFAAAIRGSASSMQIPCRKGLPSRRSLSSTCRLAWRIAAGPRAAPLR